MAEQISNIRALGQKVRLSLMDGSLELLPVPNNELPHDWKSDLIGRHLRGGMHYVFIFIFVRVYLIFIAISFHNSNYIS